MKSWAILTPYTGKPLTCFFCFCFHSHVILYPIQVYCYPFGHFDLKETKKRPILVNNKPNCAGNTVRAHRGIAPKFDTLSADMSAGRAVNLIPYFWDFPVFDTLNTIRALRAWWRKRYTLFTRFYLRGWCTGGNRPQWGGGGRVWEIFQNFCMKLAFSCTFRYHY